MHHTPEVVLLDHRQFVGLEEPFQQQNWPANAGLAQLQRFLDAGHGKTVGLLLQRLGTTHRAMAVGIRLDHRQGARAADLAGQLVVVTQGLQVDQSTGRTHDVLGYQQFSGYKKARGDGRANTYRKWDRPIYRAATIIISTSTSGLYIFASTQARAGAAPGATQASQT